MLLITDYLVRAELEMQFDVAAEPEPCLWAFDRRGRHRARRRCSDAMRTEIARIGRPVAGGEWKFLSDACEMRSKGQGRHALHPLAA